MAVLLRLLVFAVLVCGPARAFAESFTQARCSNPEHHHEWHGPRRSDTRLRLAFRDADEHNRQHRGHSARVLVVERE